MATRMALNVTTTCFSLGGVIDSKMLSLMLAQETVNRPCTVKAMFVDTVGHFLPAFEVKP